MPLREYNIVVLGAGCAGKSALVKKFVTGIFGQTVHTVQNCFTPPEDVVLRKQVEIDGQQLMLEIVDPTKPGIDTETENNTSRMQVKKGMGFVLVYDITQQSTFDYLADLRETLLREKDRDIVPMVLVGTKCDEQHRRVISTEQGELMARKFACSFLETSARKSINVDQVFHSLVRQIRTGPCPNIYDVERKNKSSCILM